MSGGGGARGRGRTRTRATRVVAPLPAGGRIVVGRPQPNVSGTGGQPRKRPRAAWRLARAGGTHALALANVLGLRPRAVPRRRRRPLWPKLVLLAVAAYAAVAIASNAVRYIVVEHQLAVVQAQTAALRREDAALRQRTAALSSASDVADEARRLLGLVDPGDIVFTPTPPH